MRKSLCLLIILLTNCGRNENQQFMSDADLAEDPSPNSTSPSSMSLTKPTGTAEKPVTKPKITLFLYLSEERFARDSMITLTVKNIPKDESIETQSTSIEIENYKIANPVGIDADFLSRNDRFELSVTGIDEDRCPLSGLFEGSLEQEQLAIPKIDVAITGSCSR